MNDKIVILLINSISDLIILITFSTLAIYFNKFALVFFSIIFMVLENIYEKKEEKNG